MIRLRERKWKESERAVILVKLQRAACSAVIWFGDLNAFAGRQLLPSALDLPAPQAEEEAEEEVAALRRVISSQ